MSEQGSTPYERMQALLKKLNYGSRRATSRRIDALHEELELPEVEAEEPEGAAEGWLFDSRRTYLGQLGFYKER